MPGESTIKEQMDRIYRDVPPERIPWNAPVPPAILQRAVSSGAPRGGSVAEFGCGAGNYLIWFAKMGYRMTGIDISERAVEIAGKSASEAGVRVDLLAADVTGPLPGVPRGFDFAYDWELLHHIFPEDRERYVENVARLLGPGGGYFSVCFSEESPQFGGVGKYRKTPLGTVLYFSSEEELGALFRRHFAVEELRTEDVRGKGVVHRAVCARMRKGSPGP